MAARKFVLTLTTSASAPLGRVTAVTGDTIAAGDLPDLSGTYQVAGSYQPLDATLTALAGANWVANSLAIGSGSDTVAQVTFAANTFPARASTGNLVAKTLTDFALTILDDADAATVRATIGAGTGSGTVTTASVVTANGVSGSVSNPTTTPAFTFTLGAITPSSVAASGTVTGSNLSNTNTGDQTITLTGDVTGSGTGSFATTLAAFTTADPSAINGYDDDYAAVYDASASAWRRVPLSRLNGNVWQSECRLTLSSTSEHADSTSSSILYLVGIGGGRVTIWDGTRPVQYQLANGNVGLALSGLVSKNYDVFLQSVNATAASAVAATDVITLSAVTTWTTGTQVIPATTAGGLTAGAVYYWRSITTTTGTLHPTVADAAANTNIVNITATITTAFSGLTLQLGTGWSNDTTRATAIQTTQTGSPIQSGVWVYSGDETMRYVGTIRATGTTTTSDSADQRYVWSLYNQVPKKMFSAPGYSDGNTTTQWTQSTTNFTPVNSGSGGDYEVNFVVGLAQHVACCAAARLSSGAGLCNLGLAVNTSGTKEVYSCASVTGGGTNINNFVRHTHAFAAGKYAFTFMVATSANTATFTGDRPRTGNVADPVETYVDGEILS